MSGSRTVLDRLELLALPLGDSGARSAGDSLSTKSDPAANTSREQDAELERLRTLSFFDAMSGGNPPAGAPSGAPSGSGRGSSRSRRSSSTQPPPAGPGAPPPFSPPLPGSYGAPYPPYNPYTPHPPHIAPPPQPGASPDPLAALFGPAPTPSPHPHPPPLPFGQPSGLPGHAPSLPSYAPWLYGAPPPAGPYGHPAYPQYATPGAPLLPPLNPGAGIPTGSAGLTVGGSPPGQHRPAGSSRDMTTEEIAMIEDKRRRNTAASARFRLKKKARTVNLERTVSDLEGRANDLEKEASELRRENTFLKNLIMQRATRRRGGGHRDVQEGPSSRPDQSDSGSEEEGDSTDSEEARASRQKGKGKGKGKQKESDAGE